MIAFLLAACGSAPEEPAAHAEPAKQQAAADPASFARDDRQWKYFGAEFTVPVPVPASTVLKDPAAAASGPVRIRGEAAEVCQKMGCWMVVRDDQGNLMRVTMKDHAFGLDKDISGRWCDIEGTLVKKAVDPAQVEHFKSEGSTHTPEAGKTEAWELVATSVAVKRS